MIMELDKYERAAVLQRNIDWYKNKVRRINDFLGGNYCDRVSGAVKHLVDESCISGLDDIVDAEIKVYRDKLEKEIEKLKKEFEQL